MGFGYQGAMHGYSSNRNWLHILGGASFLIVIIANYLRIDDLKESILTGLLDFDTSLKTYIDTQLIGSGDVIIPILVIIAHLFIYVYIFLLFQYYVFPNTGLFSNFLIVSIVILLLHVIKFTFFDNNPFSFSAMSGLLPYSGVWHLLSNFGALTGDGVGKVVEENITNATNSSGVNLDLT